MEDRIIYILKEEKEQSGDDWCNGLGVNNIMLWHERETLSSTHYQPDNDILLEICRL